MYLTRRTHRRLVALALVPVLAGTACSSDSDPGFAQVETLTTEEDDDSQETAAADEPDDEPTSSEDAVTSPPASEPPPSSAAPDTAVAPSTAAPDPDEGRPSEPLAVREGTAPFVELRIVDLRRTGKTVTLDFEIVTGSEAPGASDFVSDLFTAPEDTFQVGSDVSALDPRRVQLSGVTLVDQQNRKRHLVLRDERTLCLCSSWPSAVAQPDTAHAFFAQFPAPPADVTTMSVHVPQFPGIDRVPLREAS